MTQIQPMPQEPMPAQPLGLVDALAVAAIAVFAAAAVAEYERHWLLHPLVASLCVLPFGVLPPFGVGVERGRTGTVSSTVAATVALAASLGAILGSVLFEGARETWLSLLVRALPPLLVGAPLARLGVRFTRADEPWRAAARRGPPEATPAFALRIAHTRLPRPLRVLLAPLALVTEPAALALVVLVRIYQITASRLMAPACRFEPSCSRYGFEALRRHGLVRGVILTNYRLVRCQPFCTGGHDPVPDVVPASAAGGEPAAR